MHRLSGSCESPVTGDPPDPGCRCNCNSILGGVLCNSGSGGVQKRGATGHPEKVTFLTLARDRVQVARVALRSATRATWPWYRARSKKRTFLGTRVASLFWTPPEPELHRTPPRIELRSCTHTPRLLSQYSLPQTPEPSFTPPDSRSCIAARKSRGR